MTAIIENGILVGWWSTIRAADGRTLKTFIPRREEDIDADRAAFLPRRALKR